MNQFMYIFEKQDPDIARSLQTNPVSIYTKFWTVPIQIRYILENLDFQCIFLLHPHQNFDELLRDLFLLIYRLA